MIQNRPTAFFGAVDVCALVDRYAEYFVEAAEALHLALEQPRTHDEQAAHLQEVIERADEVNRQLLAAVAAHALTPLDRQALLSLVEALEEAIDTVHVALARVGLAQLRGCSPVAQQLAALLLQQANALQRAVPLLPTRRGRVQFHWYLQTVHNLEERGDRLIEQTLAAMYEHVPNLPTLVERLKWRAVYDLLEAATDRAQDVAYALTALSARDD